MSARISRRVTAERRARAARTMFPRFTEEQGSSANSPEAVFIKPPAQKKIVPLHCHGTPDTVVRIPGGADLENKMRLLKYSQQSRHGAASECGHHTEWGEWGRREEGLSNNTSVLISNYTGAVISHNPLGTQTQHGTAVPSRTAVSGSFGLQCFQSSSESFAFKPKAAACPVNARGSATARGAVNNSGRWPGWLRRRLHSGQGCASWQAPAFHSLWGCICCGRRLGFRWYPCSWVTMKSKGCFKQQQKFL